MTLRVSVTAPSAIVLFLLLTTGCATRQYATPEEAIANTCTALGPKALSGALIGGLGGAAGGAAIGAAIGKGSGSAIGAGAGLLIGLIAGIAAGNQMDQQDCREAHIALQRLENQPVNQPIAWGNYSTGSHGNFTPVSAEYNLNSHVCRQIRADYSIKDHEPVYGDTGVICRTANGDWARMGLNT